MVNWLLEGRFLQKWNLLKQRPAILIISLFYLVHLLGMIYTSDFSWGFHDLRIKLPLFVLPFVIGTSAPLNNKQLKIILNFYLAAVLIGSIISAYFIFGFDGRSVHTIVQISPFISHIRWSLMVVMSIFIIFWLIIKYQGWIRWSYIPLIIWLVFYLFILQVLTGIVIFILTSAIILIRIAFTSKQLMLKWFTIIIFFTLLLLSGSYISHAYARFFTFEKIDAKTLTKSTAKGNPYSHDLTSKCVENGHYIYMYICEPELRESWNKRSKLNYDGKALDGAALKDCLIRYLTSKGLRKDAEGINKLTDNEIKYIELGMTNYIATDKYALYPRVYTAMWELYNYSLGANPSGYSISQRIEFIKTAFHIIENNFWFGVGTGDVPDAFSRQYEIDNSKLAKQNRLRAHNQLVTFMLTFGIFGFLIILISLLAPAIILKKFSNYLFLVIFIIGFLSFLNEDTLETHQGISFFAFFYALFLFYDSKIPNEPSMISNSEKGMKTSIMEVLPKAFLGNMRPIE